MHLAWPRLHASSQPDCDHPLLLLFADVILPSLLRPPPCSVQCILMGFAAGTLFLNTSKSNLQDAQLFMAVGFFSVLIQVGRD